jgi:predicted nucleotidyltransferase
MEIDIKKARRILYKKYIPHVNLLIQEIKNILKNNLVSIILFGSYAKGDFTVNSDIDILVIIEDTEVDYRERINDFLDKIDGLTLPFLVSPIILTKKEAEVFHSLYLDILDAHNIAVDKGNYFKGIMEKVFEIKKRGLIEEKKLSGKTYWKVNYEGEIG